jgi:hypothetical protein
MKKDLILGSLLAFAGITNAQNVFPNPGPGYVGIGTTSPNQPLEVIATTSGANGIIVTQPTATNAQAAAISLDNSANTGKRWMLYSSGPGDGIGAGNFSIYDWYGGVDRFTIQGSTGNIGMGTTTPIARLHAVGGSVGVKADANGGSSTGFYGTAQGNNNTLGVTAGVYGLGFGAHRNNGAFFESYGGGLAVGVVSYALYAKINNPGTSDYAGFFDGNVNINGNAYCTSSAWSSDKKLKKDIKLLTNGLDKIKLLKPSTYTFRTDEFKTMNLPKENQLGIIAQELEQVFPELVTEIAEQSQMDKDGKITGTIPSHKVVNYIGLIPVLIAGVQEQQTTIEAQQKTIDQQSQINADLQKQLDEQKQLINSLSQKASGTTGINSVGTIDSGFQMLQNEPNPFTLETVVKYTLPQTVSNAFMAVYDLTGKQIVTFPIQTKGSSSVTVTSEKLSAGIYIYSIVADGKVVDSKRMIVAGK